LSNPDYGFSRVGQLPIYEQSIADVGLEINFTVRGDEAVQVSHLDRCHPLD
jgi:hypothetical protein